VRWPGRLLEPQRALPAVILGAVPPGCGAALEAGCGDGLLARRLAGRCGTVTAIDRDARMIALARSAAREDDLTRVTFVEADFLAYPVAEASFDFACANTSLHHMDFAAALTAMARALRPGGRLAVVGGSRRTGRSSADLASHNRPSLPTRSIRPAA
jgi:ubiquinone/menaquinone biosynthesis C-methylase UbiE